ncbi:MAG: sulfite exporter TauE/SafE family protein [Sulfurospirillum sp.]|nr:sulfite exporter TauE/SafE family protein [Sulfurospirillum sp.]MBL0702673.1 sulfite exporter TauE/SafE family protein [Sulfurospirillum sp.]
MLYELLLIGLTVGFMSGLFGIGGGALLVPALMYLGFSIKYAIGISVMQMVFSSIFGSYLNLKKGTFSIKDGLVLGIGGFLGAQGSGFLINYLSSMTLSNIFVFSICLSILKFFKSSSQSDKPEIKSKVLLFSIGVFVGLIAISVGIGGGLFLTPILVGFLNYDIKKAVSMSLFFIVFSSVSGIISISQFSYIDYRVGMIVGISSLFGVFLGIKSSYKIDEKNHKALLLGLYIVILIMTINKLYF